MVEYPAAIAVKLPQRPGSGVAVLVDVRVAVEVRVDVWVTVGVCVLVDVCVTVAVCVAVLVRVLVLVGVLVFSGPNAKQTSVGVLRLTRSHTPSSPVEFIPQQ